MVGVSTKGFSSQIHYYPVLVSYGGSEYLASTLSSLTSHPYHKYGNSRTGLPGTQCYHRRSGKLGPQHELSSSPQCKPPKLTCLAQQGPPIPRRRRSSLPYGELRQRPRDRTQNLGAHERLRPGRDAPSLLRSRTGEGIAVETHCAAPEGTH